MSLGGGVGLGVIGGADDTSERDSFGGTGGGISIEGAVTCGKVVGGGLLIVVSTGGDVGNVCCDGVSIILPLVPIAGSPFSIPFVAKLSLKPAVSLASLSLSSSPYSSMGGNSVLKSFVNPSLSLFPKLPNDENAASKSSFVATFGGPEDAEKANGSERFEGSDDSVG